MMRHTIRFLLLTCLSIGALAESFQFEEGTHYVKLETPVATRNPAIVEVTEYFSYGCPHCYRFEPLIAQWKENLPADVEFNRTPAVWQVTGYELFARTYYTLQALGVLEDVHGDLFNAIHGERRRLYDLESMSAFLATKGVDQAAFVKTFNDSFGVKAMFQQAIARQRLYRSGGVPAIIVNGKYRVEAGMVDNSNANMLRVVSFLVDRERRMLASESTGGD